MAPDDPLVWGQFVLRPRPVLVLSDKLDLGSFVCLEFNTRYPKDRRFDFNLSHCLILRNGVLNRKGIRTKLRSHAIVKHESQAVNCKSDVALHLFQ